MWSAARAIVSRKLERRLSRFRDVEHRDATRRAVEQVDDVIELGREQMNVLAIDRRDEAAIDPRADVVRQHVRLVLDGL